VARGNLLWQALGIRGGLRRRSRAVPVAMVASQGGGGAALRWWSWSSPAWSEVEDGVLQRMGWHFAASSLLLVCLSGHGDASTLVGLGRAGDGGHHQIWPPMRGVVLPPAGRNLTPLLVDTGGSPLPRRGKVRLVVWEGPALIAATGGRQCGSCPGLETLVLDGGHKFGCCPGTERSGLSTVPCGGRWC
jgi:hypothetical protein